MVQVQVSVQVQVQLAGRQLRLREVPNRQVLLPPCLGIFPTVRCTAVMIGSAHQTAGDLAMVAEPGSVDDRVPQLLLSARGLASVPQTTLLSNKFRAHSVSLSTSDRPL